MLWGDQVAKAGDDSKAIALYREAMPELASNPDLHVRLGMAYARQERLGESQTEFEAVLRIDPKSLDCPAGDRCDRCAAQGHRKIVLAVSFTFNTRFRMC